MSHDGHSGPGNLLSLKGSTASIASLQLLPLPCFRGRSREPRTLEVSWQESDPRCSKHWESCVTVFCERSHLWPFQDHSFVRVYGGAPSLGWRWERVAPSLSQWEGRAMPQSSAPTRLPRKPHSQSFAKPGKGSRASLESPLNKSYRDGLAPLQNMGPLAMNCSQLKLRKILFAVMYNTPRSLINSISLLPLLNSSGLP